MDLLRGFLGQLGFSEMQESQPEQHWRSCCHKEKAIIKYQLDVTVTFIWKNGRKDSRNRPWSRISPGLVAVHVEKLTPASPPLHSTAQYWSPHSPATLISIIWQNENTYSFLAYLCRFAFQLPLKHHSSCTNPALSILFFSPHTGLWAQQPLWYTKY